MATAVNAWIITHATDLPRLSLPEMFNENAAWRFTIFTGLIPTVPIALMWNHFTLISVPGSRC